MTGASEQLLLPSLNFFVLRCFPHYLETRLVWESMVSTILTVHLAPAMSPQCVPVTKGGDCHQARYYRIRWKPCSVYFTYMRANPWRHISNDPFTIAKQECGKSWPQQGNRPPLLSDLEMRNNAKNLRWRLRRWNICLCSKSFWFQTIALLKERIVDAYLKTNTKTGRLPIWSTLLTTPSKSKFNTPNYWSQSCVIQDPAWKSHLIGLSENHFEWSLVGK